MAGHRKISLWEGESIDILLPSGKRLNLEATQDTISVTGGPDDDQVFYSEEKIQEKWEQAYPAPLIKY